MRPDPDRKRTWILAINASHARILPLIDSPENGETVFEAPKHRPQDVLADRQGRAAVPGGGGRRAAMEHGSDPLHKETREFLDNVIEALERMQRADDLRFFAVFADPSMLGHLREVMPQALRDLVLFETAKNIVDLDATEIRQRAAAEPSGL